MTSKPTERAGIGVIGLGKMGRCLVQGLLGSGTFSREQIFFTTRHKETSEQAARDFGVQACATNREVVEKCETLVLAVKPQSIGEVLTETKQHLKSHQSLVSIVASISTGQIEKALGKEIPVIRAMPNTPAFVKAGITAACLGRFASERDWKRANHLFLTLGKFVRVDEKHMDAVTGLSGCGPAYIYLILESLTDGGIKVGLPRELAMLLAAQTMLGSAKMLLETGRHPAALKDEVTTPAGCTIDGLMELEEGKLRVTLIKAVVQATKRAQDLGQEE